MNIFDGAIGRFCYCCVSMTAEDVGSCCDTGFQTTDMMINCKY